MSLKNLDLKKPEEQSEQSYKDRIYRFLSTKKSFGSITVLPVLLLLTLVFVFPILWALAASFHQIGTLDPVWEWVGLENYVTLVFEDQFFRYTLWLSVVFAVSSIAIQTIFGVLFAVLLNRDFPFKKGVLSVVFLPFLIPTALFSYGVIFMLESRGGVVNWFLVNIGLIEDTIGFLGHSDFALWTVVLANSWKYIAFVTIMVYARLQSIPEDHYEAARMFGANVWRQFWDVTLPNIKGVLFIVVLINGLWMFFKFDVIYIITSGGPASSTEISVVYAYKMAFESNNLGMATAMSVVLFLVVILVAIPYFYFAEPDKEVEV